MGDGWVGWGGDTLYNTRQLHVFSFSLIMVLCVVF